MKSIGERTYRTWEEKEKFVDEFHAGTETVAEFCRNRKLDTKPPASLGSLLSTSRDSTEVFDTLMDTAGGLEEENLALRELVIHLAKALPADTPIPLRLASLFWKVTK